MNHIDIKALKEGLILNKEKQYVGVEIGSGWTSRVIQLKTKGISGLPLRETASHVLGIAYNNGWFLYESDYKIGGVGKYPLDEYLENFGNKNIHFYEQSLNVKTLEYFDCYNPGYGTFDILTKAPVIDDLLENNDGPGLICSEYMAYADEFEICHRFNLPANAITPAHWQVYLREKNK